VRLTRRRMSQERGAAAVEFAIVAGLLFMVLFGTIQFGLAYYRYQGLNAAAREGARLGALTQTTKGQIITRVQNSVAALPTSAFATNPCPGTLALDAGCVDIYIRSGTTTSACPSASCVSVGGASTVQPCNLQAGKTVVVRAKYKMDIPVPLWATPQITITGVGEFKCEA
jgi:Flp pilus assembly protein TadG